MLPGFDKMGGMSKRAFANLENLIDILMRHPRSNPIHSKDLEETFRLPDSQIRKMVSYLRCKNEPIGSDQNGYFWAVEADELNETRGHIQGRFRHLQAVDRGVEGAQNRLRTGKNIRQGTLL